MSHFVPIATLEECQRDASAFFADRRRANRPEGEPDVQDVEMVPVDAVPEPEVPRPGTPVPFPDLSPNSTPRRVSGAGSSSRSADLAQSQPIPAVVPAAVTASTVQAVPQEESQAVGDPFGNIGIDLSVIQLLCRQSGMQEPESVSKVVQSLPSLILMAGSAKKTQADVATAKKTSEDRIGDLEKKLAATHAEVLELRQKLAASERRNTETSEALEAAEAARDTERNVRRRIAADSSRVLQKVVSDAQAELQSLLESAPADEAS